ncbi:MAG: DNRLRE domain-containing protein, partial [Chloroflexota bacterium]
ARHYSDTPLAPSSTHSYTIKAFDAAGNRSAPSGPISLTTSNGTVTVTLIPVADSYVSSTSPTTNYGTSTVLRVQSGSATLRSYLRFDLSGVVGSIQDATLRVYSNSTGPYGYDVFGVANTTWGETSINDTNAPAIGPPTGISSGAVVTGSWTSVNVSSLISGPNAGLVSLALGPSGTTQRSFSSREGAFAPQLILTVGAVNGGPPTASFTASTMTVTAGLPVSFTDTSTGGATSWSWSFGDAATSTAQNPSHTWATPGTYTVTLIASNSSGPSAPATAQIDVVADTAAPSTPGNLTATPASGTRIDLAWSTSIDNVAVTGYRVYRDGNPTPIATVGGATLGYADLTVAPGTTYTYTVDAIDAAGNPSTPTGPVPATTPSGSVTFTRNPIADAYVDSVNATTNYGTNSSIRVSGPSQIRNAYLKFDLTGISPSIMSATLRVYCISGCSTTGFAARAVMDSTWGESSITYANAPGFSSSIAGSSGALVLGWNTVDVSSIVTAGAGGLTSMVLTTTGSQINLSSKEGVGVPELVMVVGGP